MMSNGYRYTLMSQLDEQALSELRALVSRSLPTLTWRHRAIGALQGYVAEDREPEVRVHIWHPQLVLVDTDRDGGRPHDHRFTLRSTVLAGAIGHEELIVEEHERGAFDEYEVQHARLGAAPLKPTGRRLHARTLSAVIPAGQTYTFPARRFHRSFVVGPAVTLVSKNRQTEDPARVLFPVGCEPVFGVHPIEASVAKRYVDDAITWMRG